MKKIYAIVIAAIFMLLAGKASAQISVHAGYQNPSLGTSGFAINYNGFFVGGSYNIDLANQFGVAPGLFFSYAYCKMNEDNLMEFRVPILANYGIDVTRDVRVFGFAGPMLGLNFVSKMDFRRFDLGLMFGAGAKYQKISVELGYNIGLLNRFDDTKLKMNHFVVGLGYSF